MEETNLLSTDWLITGNVTYFEKFDSYLVTGLGDPWNLNAAVWRSPIYVSSWSEMDQDPKIHSIAITYKFKLPTLPLSDDHTINFTVKSRFNTTFVEDPIEDSHVVINNQSFDPASIVYNSSGSYYTYQISAKNFVEQDQISITFTYGEWTQTSGEIVGKSWYHYFQTNLATITTTQSATDAYLGNVENELKDLNDKMDEILKEDPAINSQFNDQANKLEDNAAAISSKSVLASYSYVDKQNLINAMGNFVISDDSFEKVSSVYAPILGNNYVVIAMTLACTLALGGYVIFGKRG